MKSCGKFHFEIIEPDNEDNDYNDYGEVLVICDDDDYLISLEQEGMYLIESTYGGSKDVRKPADIIGIDGE